MSRPEDQSEAVEGALNAVPSIPRDDNGPVFAEPWQAQAFAMTIALHEGGHFTWNEWVEVFSTEIARAQENGDPDLGDTYYHHWLAALERIITERGIAAGAILADLRDAWDRAAKATPHGNPIFLDDQVIEAVRRS